MYHNKIIVLLSWIAAFLWMLLIFNLSSQIAEQSDKLSRGVTEIVVGTVEKVAHGYDFDINKFNHLLRKNSHFFAYLVLVVLVMNANRRSGVKGFRVYVLTLGICALYAVSDEVHQLFVPGRGGEVKDVLIDSAGAILGLGVYWVLGRIRVIAIKF